MSPPKGRPERAQTCLRGGSWPELLARVDHQRRLLEIVRNALPDFLANHCRHCVPKADRLLLFVDSAGFASQLRFFGPQVVAAVNAASELRFRDIQVRNLLPDTLPPVAAIASLPPRPRPEPSPTLQAALARLELTVARIRRE